MSEYLKPSEADIDASVLLALNEDLRPPDRRAQPWPDTEALHKLDPSLRWVKARTAQMRLSAGSAGVLCGARWFDRSQQLVDRRTQIDWRCDDGEAFGPGAVLAHIHGCNRSLLLAERTALNFLQLLSATAGLARRYTQALAQSPSPVKTRLLDTRKTLPGLRAAQKYAVRCGGGVNHRFGLFDALMFKDNHLGQILLSSGAGVEFDFDLAEWRQWRQENAQIQVIIEVEDMAMLRKVLALEPDRVLLDNCAPGQLRPLAQLARAHGVATEASGSIGTDELAGCVAAGVDFISVGALTKNVNAPDFSLHFVSPDN